MDSAIDTHLQRITQLREQRTLLHHKLNDIEAEIWGLYHVVDTLRSSSAVATPSATPPYNTQASILHPRDRLG